MTLPKISDVEKMDAASLSEEVLSIKRELFDLRLKKATRQDFQPHLFRHFKHRLAQLLTVETLRTKSTK